MYILWKVIGLGSLVHLCSSFPLSAAMVHGLW